MTNKMYGHFDDAAREYVITDPQTPWPWINYLGNEDFFSLISNTAGGSGGPSLCRTRQDATSLECGVANRP